MNELDQLYQEATGTTRPPSTQAVTQRIQRRFRRRRAGRFGAGVLAAAALVLGGVAWHGGAAMPPAPIDTAAQLPTDRPVGRGQYVQPYFATDGNTPRNALLRTRSGSRYVVPGRIGPTAALLGTPVSPDGRWLVSSVGHDVVVRDLTGHRTYHTGRAGKDGFPVAWSSDGRWLVLRSASDGNHIDDTLFRLDLNNGTVGRLALGAHHSADEIAAILPTASRSSRYRAARRRRNRPGNSSSGTAAASTRWSTRVPAHCAGPTRCRTRSCGSRRTWPGSIRPRRSTRRGSPGWRRPGHR